MLFLYLMNIEKEYYKLVEIKIICSLIINSTQGHISSSSFMTYSSLPFSLPTEKQYKWK